MNTYWDFGQLDNGMGTQYRPRDNWGSQMASPYPCLPSSPAKAVSCDSDDFSSVVYAWNAEYFAVTYNKQK